MPAGSKVEEVYRALRDKGMSKERAAKIAQAQTGQALATGKPPKHENSVHYQNGCTKAENALKNMGASPINKDLLTKVREFFVANPNPDDSQVHALSEQLGIDPHILEKHIYHLLSMELGKA